MIIPCKALHWGEQALVDLQYQVTLVGTPPCCCPRGGRQRGSLNSWTAASSGVAGVGFLVQKLFWHFLLQLKDSSFYSACSQTKRENWPKNL